MSELSKLVTVLHKTHQGPSDTKAPRLDICRSMLSLSKTVHQMSRDHPFSQRNSTRDRTTERIGSLGGWR